MTSPARQVFTRSATIPAGTPLDAPVTVTVTIGQGSVVLIRWRVPPGPSGLLGWALTDPSGTQIIPSHSGWIVADDESDDWPVTGQIDSGDWAVTGYNTGTYDHSVYLDFLVTPTPTPAPDASNTSVLDSLTAAVSAAASGG